MQMETCFKKIIQHILSNFSYEAAWSWNQSFVISRSWDNFSSKDTKKHVPNLWCKHTFLKTLNRKSRDTTIISGEIWSSCLKISKVTILKKCVKLPKKLPVTEFTQKHFTYTTCNFNIKRPSAKVKNGYSIECQRYI